MRRLKVDLDLVDDALRLEDLFGGTHLLAQIELREKLVALGPQVFPTLTSAVTETAARHALVPQMHDLVVDRTQAVLLARYFIDDLRAGGAALALVCFVASFDP